MLDLFGWNPGIGALAAFILVIGAIAIGVVAQYIGSANAGYEWIFTSVGALVGGWLGSEAFGALSTWGLVTDGLYIVPALIGGLVLGAAVDIVIRFSTGGTYVAHQPV
jgi:hypothetical protein